MVKNNMKRIFKKYGYYFVGALLLLAIGVTTLFATGGRGNNPAINVGTDPITFRMPMNSATVIKEYSAEHILNQTLNKYTTHRAYSLTSEDLKVFAVAKGTVSEVGKSFELGNYVTIDHGDGVKSFYASLGTDVLVSAGTKVEKGQSIGMASDSAENFFLDGNHLYFRMYKQDKIVDPATYLNFSNK